MKTTKVDEEICDKCEGRGFYLVIRKTPIFDRMAKVCNRCNGEGEIDWIQKIIPPNSKYTLEIIMQRFYYKHTRMRVTDEIENYYMWAFCFSQCKLIEEE